jgi:hypothetical protein
MSEAVSLERLRMAAEFLRDRYGYSLSEAYLQMSSPMFLNMMREDIPIWLAVCILVNRV